MWTGVSSVTQGLSEIMHVKYLARNLACNRCANSGPPIRPREGSILLPALNLNSCMAFHNLQNVAAVYLSQTFLSTSPLKADSSLLFYQCPR